MSKSVKSAIFYPLIKRNTFLVFTLIVMLLLFFIGLILPDNYDYGSRYFSQDFLIIFLILSITFYIQSLHGLPLLFIYSY